MATTGEGSKPRRPRADGERNKAALIAAAKECFQAYGLSASLDQIARDAGVGIGTLYRHFPTKDDLIEGVYRNETDRLQDAATDLAETNSPVDALRAWLMLFVDFLEAKQNLGNVLESLIGGPDKLYRDTPSLLSPPITALVAAANETREINLTIEPLDLLRAVVGVATIRPTPAWRQQTEALVDLLLRGAQVQLPRILRRTTAVGV